MSWWGTVDSVGNHFDLFSLKSCDIAFKCLTGSSMVFGHTARYQMRLFELLLKRSLLLTLYR